MPQSEYIPPQRALELAPTASPEEQIRLLQEENRRLREALRQAQNSASPENHGGTPGGLPFHVIADAAPAMLWMTDAEARCTFLSQTWYHFTGQTEEEALGFGWLDAVHPDDLARTRDVFLEASKRGMPFEFDYRVRGRDGLYRWAIDAGRPFHNVAGEFMGFVGSVIDIHHRKVAEQALDAREQHLRLALQAGRMGTWTVDVASGVATVDEVEAHLLGLPEDAREVPLNTLLAITHPEDRQRVRDEVRQAATSGAYHAEFRVVHPDGTLRWLSSVGCALRDPATGAMTRIGIDFDITERIEAAAAVQESETRFRATFEQAAVGVAHVGLSGEWIRVNDRLCTITGYSREELQGLTFQDITHPDDLAADLAYFEQQLAGEIDTYEMEKRYVHKTGTIVWIHLTVSLVRDAITNEPDYFIAVVQDIRERKEAQASLRLLTRTLEQQVAERTDMLAHANEALTARNRELRDFAYVASHDLQEPLRKIQQFAGLLQAEQSHNLDEQGRYYVSRMEGAAARLSALITALLSFSRIATQARPFESVALDGVVAQVCDDLSLRIRDVGARIITRDLPMVNADPVQMHQLMQNLISNAVKYHRKNVTPVVEVHGCSPSEAVPPDMVQFMVADNGIGFDERYLDRIFSPFQRLHGASEFEGTGMGLAICRRIVERHGGVITAQSTPDEGSRFIVTLPAAPQQT